MVFDFDRCYGHKSGCQNKLKVGKRQFWNTFETFDEEINVEHKQILKSNFNGMTRIIMVDNIFNVVLFGT